MTEIEKVLVGLDFSKMDKELIRYTAFLDASFGFQRITFIHIAKTLEIPQQILAKYPNLLAPLDESIQREMEKEINGVLINSKAEIEFKVVEGHPEVEMLKWVKIKDVDLLILGKKKNEKGAGMVPSKVGRAANSSVLVLPEGAKAQIKRILLPVDFSDHSENCLKRMIAPAKEIGAEIIIEHVYQVPNGYTKTGKSFEEFGAIMHKNAKGQMREFLKKLELLHLEPSAVFRLDQGHDPSDEIMGAAEKHNIDLIVLASKGRSDPAAFLLGSLAEKLVQRNYSIPVLVDKNKGTTMKFLEALLNI